jgi:hypothetical protein
MYIVQEAHKNYTLILNVEFFLNLILFVREN